MSSPSTSVSVAVRLLHAKSCRFEDATLVCDKDTTAASVAAVLFERLDAYVGAPAKRREVAVAKVGGSAVVSKTRTTAGDLSRREGRLEITLRSDKRHVAMVSVVRAWSLADNRAEMRKLREDVDALNSNVAGLTDRVNALETADSALVITVASLDARVGTLEATLLRASLLTAVRNVVERMQVRAARHVTDPARAAALPENGRKGDWRDVRGALAKELGVRPEGESREATIALLAERVEELIEDLVPDAEQRRAYAWILSDAKIFGTASSGVHGLGTAETARVFRAFVLASARVGPEPSISARVGNDAATQLMLEVARSERSADIFVGVAERVFAAPDCRAVLGDSRMVGGLLGILEAMAGE